MDKQYKAYSILLYIIWPFSALFIGIRNFDFAFGRKLLIAVFVFLGYTTLESGDLERYAKHYYEVSEMSFNEIIKLFLNLKVSKLFNDVTAIVFSPFDNHHIYFSFLFGVYGYLLVNTINFLRMRLLRKATPPVLISFIAFAFFYSVLTVFNYAFYTGAIYFLFFLIKIVLHKQKTSYFLILFAPLFHVALAPLLLIPLFYFVFKQRTNLYILVLLVFTFVSQTVLINNLSTYLVDSDTVLENKYNAYASEVGKERMDLKYSEGLQQGNTNYRLFRDIRNVSNRFAIPLLLIVLYFNRKKFKKDENLLNLFNISIGCLSITQLMLNISQGERFYFISGFMALATFTYFTQKFHFLSLRFKFPLYAIIVCVLLNDMVSIVMVKNLISSDFLLSNFPYLILKLL
jgi:hypothetical protein